MKLTAPLHLVVRLRLCEAIAPFLMSSWHYTRYKIKYRDNLILRICIFPMITPVKSHTDT
jgi:hypothetical protein